jgi:hypothetical protein
LDSTAKKKARPPPPWANPVSPTKVPRNSSTSDAAAAAAALAPPQDVQQAPGHGTSSPSWAVPDDGRSQPWSQNSQQWSSGSWEGTGWTQHDPHDQPDEDWYWEASSEETDLAKSLNIPWRLRGPPGPTAEGERFRGQRWRANTERWANRGGHRRDWFKCYYTALSKGSSKREAQDLADNSFPEQTK